MSSATSQVQTLARQIANTVDTDKNGQVSVTEFGDFIKSVLQGTTSLSAVSSASTASGASGTTAPLGFTPNFRGFDASRAASAIGTLKYDAYNLLQNYDPRDVTAMRRAFTALNALHPGQYELDPQDNLMLTGTADGYIGARPVNRDSDWFNRTQEWSWDWFAYNPAHPGPSGEVT